MKKYLALFLMLGTAAQAQTLPLGFQSHNFQYLTAVLNSSQRESSVTANAFNAQSPPKWFSMSVTTAATGWLVALDGSLDNRNWSTIAITSSALGVISNKDPVPSLFFRFRAMTALTNISVTPTAIGVW